MNVTPKDILEKEFAKKFNGYDPEQVDEFLDEIIKQFESLIEENEDLIVKNEAMKSQLAKMKSKMNKLEDIEDKLMRSITDAQRSASSYIEKAEVQAQKIMDIANQNAKTVIESTHLRMEAAKHEILKYEKIITDYKSNFRSLLEEQASLLDSKMLDNGTLRSSAAEIAKSINNLTLQIKDLDKSNTNTSIHLNDIIKQTREETNYDFQHNTSDLQDIVNEIIED